LKNTSYFNYNGLVVKGYSNNGDTCDRVPLVQILGMYYPGPIVIDALG